jgi:hypothetical protein
VLILRQDCCCTKVTRLRSKLNLATTKKRFVQKKKKKNKKTKKKKKKKKKKGKQKKGERFQLNDGFEFINSMTKINNGQ